MPRALVRGRLAILLAWVVLGTHRCDAPSSGRHATPDPENTPLFRELSSEVGLDFRHVNGAMGDFYFPEIMGSGAAFLDYDNDGDLDIYLLQGGSVDGGTKAGNPVNRLFRNDLSISSDGVSPLRFEDVTASAGAGDKGYGMGVAVGDYNNDGFLDLYVTNYGPNALYRNEGNGTFTEVGRLAGVDDDGWGTSASFFDFDQDGYLDLFVANYVDFSVGQNEVCRPTGVRDYCHPSNFEPQADVLYRNRGDGTFADATQSSGVNEAYGSGLGTAILDFDGDGWLDVYVANDGNENQLWQNRGDGTFENVALFNGAALNMDGAAEAGMGVAVDDFDLDGDPDVFVTHLRDETNTLYQNQGYGLFEDVTFAFGLGYASLSATSFGVHWFDYDNDGYLDLFCANGAVALGGETRDNVSPYAEPNQLFHNEAGRSFEDVTTEAGSALSLVDVSRGAAFGDVDNDGDVDVLVSNNGGPARLLLNQVGAERHWISFKLSRTRGNPQALGAKVTLARADGARSSRLVHTDGSYCSSNDIRVHFGLNGDTSVAGVEVSWPGGGVEFFPEVLVDRENELVEGMGSRR